MAYNYDEFGNVISEFESEEERRAREAKELADTAVHTTERKVYGDGTVEETTKKEIPPGMQPKVVAPIEPQLTQSQPKPQFDQTAYNASIAQAESGNRANIGYHDKTKSSAFGLYGLTQPAYQDARRIDPSLPEDITQATPEQQQQAQNIFTGNNAKFLQSKGVEPTPGVLSAAHFAGANGLYKFLTQTDDQGRPFISPQAQAANGGYDKTRAIIEGRLSGQAVPSSGAANLPPQAQPSEGIAVATGQGVQGTQSMAPGPISPEQANQQAQQFAQSMQQFAQQQPQPNSFDEFGTPVYSPQQAKLDQHINTFQSNQDNLKGLNDLIDSDAPDYLKKRAADRRYELVNAEYQKQKAQDKLSTLTPTEAGRLLSTTPKDQEGSWLKFLLLGFISPQLAGAEAIKLGLAPTRWSNATITDDNGKEINVEVQTRADGKILSGNIAGSGQALTDEQLQQAAGGVSMGKGFKPEVSGTAYVKTDAQGNVVARGVRVTETRAGKTKTYIESGGTKFDINSGWEPESITTATAKTKAQKEVSLAFDPIIAAATAGAKELGEANAKYGTNFTIAGYGAPGSANAGKPILVDQNTNQIVTPDAQGKVTVSTGVAPTVGGTAALATGEKLRGERSQAMNKVLDEEVRPQAQAGDTVSSVRKQQFAIFDRPGIDANKLFGLANAAGEGENAQKYTMLRDLLSGYVARNSDGTPMNGTQLSERFAGLNLTPQEKSALAEYNIANQKINAATLKQTAGPGSVSDAEQRANRESNVDPTKIPALGAFNAMGQSQFDGDRARYKADWAAGQTFGSALEMDKAWRKENQRLSENYSAIAKDRIKFINDNGNTYNAVREGYRRFPVPEYDPGTESWKKTKPLSSFNR